MFLCQGVILNTTPAQRRQLSDRIRREKQSATARRKHADEEKQRLKDMPLDKKLTSNEKHAARESLRRKNRTLEESLAYKKTRVRIVKQGKLTLDQPDDMPADNYLNSFESNPIAAQVLI